MGRGDFDSDVTRAMSDAISASVAGSFGGSLRAGSLDEDEAGGRYDDAAAMLDRRSIARTSASSAMPPWVGIFVEASAAA